MPNDSSTSNYGHVIVTTSSGKYHEIHVLDNNSEWVFRTECGFVVTDCRVMSPQKAEKYGYRPCGKCGEDIKKQVSRNEAGDA